MFQVENLLFSVALADFAKNTTGSGVRSFYVILDSQLCFSNLVAVGDGSGWEFARALLQNGECWKAQRRPQNPRCLNVLDDLWDLRDASTYVLQSRVCLCGRSVLWFALQKVCA